MTLLFAENHPLSIRKVAPYIPLLVFVTIAVLFAGISFHAFLRIETLIVHDELQNLGAIADLKIKQISAWQKTQIRQGESFQNGYLLSDEFDRWLRQDAPSDSHRKKILEMLAGIQRLDGYQEVSLLDKQGLARISTAGVLRNNAENLALATEAMRSRKVAMSDLYRSENNGGEIMIDLAAPLVVGDGGGGSVVGAVIYQIDPHQFLYPLLQEWPTPSPSAETLLIRRDGNNVLFLNELRHIKGSALSLRFPLAALTLPAAMAVIGKSRDMDGIDYRGIAVVSEMRKVPGTDWFMVAKVDKDELLAPVTRLKQWSWTLWLVFTLLGGALLFIWLKANHARQKFLRAQNVAATEREMLLENMAYLTRRANDVIFAANESGRIIEANERAIEIYGYTHEEFLQMKIQDFLEISVDPFIIKGPMERLKERGELRVETTNRRKDGTILFVEVSARYIESQGVKYFQAIIHDITVRKHAEEQLRLHSAIISHMGEGVFLISVRDGVTIYANPKFEQMFGYEPGELVGTIASIPTYSDSEEIKKIISNGLMGKESWTDEVFNKKEDGTPFWSHVSVSTFEHHKYGTLWVFIYQDITERKLFEETRVEIERIGRVNIVGEMTSTLAHEFSQPLSAASIYLDGCLNLMAENDWDRERLLKGVRQANVQTRRAGKIINHLKELMQKQGRKREMVDINEVIKDSVNFLEQELSRHSVTATHDYADLPLTCVNRIEIEQVLFNLMKNAIESMSSQQQRELRLATCLIKSDMIMVTVSDTGTGVPKSELENVFYPFQTSKQNGLGLGLGICRSLTESHGGQIWAEQRSDCGMEFNFTLPVVVTYE